MRLQFIQDLQKIYDELQDRQKELNNYYKLLDGEHPKAEALVREFLSKQI